MTGGCAGVPHRLGIPRLTMPVSCGSRTSVPTLAPVSVSGVAGGLPRNARIWPVAGLRRMTMGRTVCSSSVNVPPRPLNAIDPSAVLPGRTGCQAVEECRLAVVGMEGAPAIAEAAWRAPSPVAGV